MDKPISTELTHISPGLLSLHSFLLLFMIYQGSLNLLCTNLLGSGRTEPGDKTEHNGYLLCFGVAKESRQRQRLAQTDVPPDWLQNL